MVVAVLLVLTPPPMLGPPDVVPGATPTAPLDAPAPEVAAPTPADPLAEPPDDPPAEPPPPPPPPPPDCANDTPLMANSIAKASALVFFIALSSPQVAVSMVRLCPRRGGLSTKRGRIALA